MSKHSPAQQTETSCSGKCKLIKHGNIITSAITKLNLTDYQLACYINSICKNYGQVLDNFGRSALHVAASCGRRDLCYWLIKNGKADINLKDHESGFTPLHRSIFYGHVNNAVSFIKMGAQLQVMDKDDLQPTDHAMKDRLIKEFSVHNPCQVYVWGTNNNYTLGIGNQHSRAQPELVDFFRKNNISVKQVAMDKFHSVFVSSVGRVWACGHGQGGRLGIGSEQTVLTPQPIKTGAEIVVSVSIGRNHTILLMESGSVWTCGSNSHHVLGHNPPPITLMSPRPIHPQVLKAVGGPIVGVAAARFHSVIWSESAVLTFGLNGGQLGHPQMPEKTIVVPKQVTVGLPQKYKIRDVVTSAGAVVISMKKGDIYVLNDYRIRKIPARINNDFVVKMSVFGGDLNADVDQKLSPKGGGDLRVMVLTSKGNVFLWQESFPQLTRCIYPLKRSLSFCGIFVCLSRVLLITKDGEAYMAHVKPKNKKKSLVSVPSPKLETVGNRSFNEFIEKMDCHHMSISRVPHVHRAVNISADPKGLNFVVIQENPKVNLTDIPIIEESEFLQQMANLLEEAQEDDSLTDLLIEGDKVSVPAHHFILALVSEEVGNLPRSSGVRTIQLPGVDFQVIQQVLTFAYTRDCDIIHVGPFQPRNSKVDIIKSALDVAKKLKIPTLIKYLQVLRFEEGMIVYKECDSVKVTKEPYLLERIMFPSLYDVVITSCDGASFKAHKCILAARLEYFNSMFTGGWIETETTRNLTLPVPQTILREILDFLYRDEAPVLVESQDVDYISSVLVVADQLFIKRLKQICEVALSGNISLRNVTYLLQFAITYNADQLKSCCLQFICLNLASILDSKVLEVLDNETLEELSKYYRNMIPAMCKRIMTPYFTQFSEEDMVEIANDCPVPWIDSELIVNDKDSPTTKLNHSNPIALKKKTITRNRKSSESQRKRFESGSSNSDFDCSIELMPTEQIDFEDLVELKSTKKPEEWVKVDKTQKTVQNRLKVLVTAATVQATPHDFTPLLMKNSLSSHDPSPSIQDNKEFPQLSTCTPTRVSTSPKTSNAETKKSPMVKISQKQRKKLLADGVKVTDPVPLAPRTPWATINTVDCSLTDIMRSTLSIGSPPSSDKSQVLMKFSDIVADEIQQRDNWSKMKSKSLQLTQIEDKAMEELRVFYNAANSFDERITVERVLSSNIAKPIWITTRHNHSNT